MFSRALLHFRVEIMNDFFAVFAADKFINKLHRAWTVKGYHGNYVFENTGLQLPQITLHAG